MSLRSKTFADLVNFARASTATYVDADGLVKTAAVDAPRFDWSTGRRGLLVEGGSTNFVKRSSHTDAFPWSAATTSDGITSTLVASGSSGGVPYADFALTGTATSTFSVQFVSPAYSRAAATLGQSWVASVYVQLLSGSLPSGVMVHVSIVEETSDNTFLTSSTSGVSPGALRRVVHARTLNRATVGIVRSGISIAYTAPGVTFSGQVLRVFGWQLEQSVAPSSLIQTLNDSAVTRAADFAAIKGLVAGTYDRRRVTASGTVDTSGVVHLGGDIALAPGVYYQSIYYPGGTL